MKWRVEDELINAVLTAAVWSTERKPKGKNTPFAGKKVYGRIEATIVDGRVVYSAAGGLGK